MSRATRWTIVLVLFAAIFVAILAAAALTSGRGPAIRSGSVLVVEIEGTLPEAEARSPLQIALEGEKPQLLTITRALRAAATDPRISAAYLRCREVDSGWAKLQELRDAIAAFRAGGKKVVSFLEMGFGGEYFLSAAADEVYLAPNGLLDVSGLMSDVAFYKGTLDKIGIQAQLEHIGAYKSASDVYTRDSMSEAHREATESILDGLYGQLRSGIAASRGMTEEEVGRLIGQGLFTGHQAMEANLVDELLYEDEVLDRLEELAGKDFPKVTPVRYARLHGSGRGPRIALVHASGIIVSGESGDGPFGESIVGADTIVDILRTVREDEGVRAVVLRVDSPGGSGIASDAIHREIQRLREEKPLVVSMSDVAASGGYYISMGADAIVAQPMTLTGSIGVISGKFTLRGFYDWIGLRREQIKRGENADLFSDYTTFTDAQREMIRGQMRSFYEDFIKKAGDGRHKTPEEIDRIAQGRVWTGEQAKKIGLLDELGGLERAIEIAREKAEIPEGRSVALDVYPRRKTLWEMFGRRERTLGDEGAQLLQKLPLSPQLKRAVIVLSVAHRLEREAVLAWNPGL